jgi:hypothetical protein
MYEVGINANPEHFLDWDKALSGQHPKVIEALRGAGVEAAGLADRPATGADIYNSLRQARRSYGPDSNGAEALQEAGVPGIRYLDQGSRIAGEGSRNLVVFNPQIVDIMKRYGVAAPVAATMLASGQYGAQAAQQQPVSPVAAAMAASPPAPR